MKSRLGSITFLLWVVALAGCSDRPTAPDAAMMLSPFGLTGDDCPEQHAMQE